MRMNGKGNGLTPLLAGKQHSGIRDSLPQRNSPKLEVHEEWLQEVFEAVDRSGGTVPFLAIQGIPAGQLEQIRNNLTVAD